MFNRKLERGEEARLITESFAGVGGAYAAGDVLVSRRWPRTIQLFSEPYVGPIPLTAIELDADAFERAHTPRPDPPEDALLDEAAIRARWPELASEAQWRAARANGFPESAGIRHRRAENLHDGAVRVTGAPVWRASAVEAWLTQARAFAASWAAGRTR
jgi:hypothetical protein